MKWIENEIELLKSNKAYRYLRNPVDENIVNLSNNDYLGITNCKDLKNEFISKFDIEKLSFGATSSRLLSGNYNEHVKAEELIGNTYKKHCLIFNSGYHANLGIIPAICKKNDLILADKLVHASIIDGIRISEAQCIRYRHLDYTHLEDILQKEHANFKNIYIISESIFSMDGDICNIEALVSLKNKYGAYLYIDEAHAVGVRGEKGLGICEEKDMIENIDIIVGTFGKALASVGAFAIADKSIIDYLINSSRSFIFSTAIPPINMAWTEFIFKKQLKYNDKRIRLRDLSKSFALQMNSTSESQIIPYILGSNERACGAAHLLQKMSFFVLPIRHPTVNKGQERLRFSLRANLKVGIEKEIYSILSQNGY